MTKAEQIVFFTKFVEKQKQILLDKGDDYAGNDRLSSFKRAGAICGLSAEQSCLSLIATKVARLGELLQGKVPKNEAALDSALDGANYFVLLAMIMSEGTPQEFQKDNTAAPKEDIFRQQSLREKGFISSSLL